MDVLVTPDSRELEQLRRRVTALEGVVAERAVVVEDALARIATLRSEIKQHQAQIRKLEKVCAERLQAIEDTATAARDREKHLQAVSEENAMLLATLRERTEIIERLQRHLRETGVRYVLRNRLRSIVAFFGRTIAASRHRKTKTGVR